MTPKIVSSRVRITPPAYAKRSSYFGAIPDSGITGLKGTQVVFELGSNRPLRMGRFQFWTKTGKHESIELMPVNDLDSGGEIYNSGTGNSGTGKSRIGVAQDPVCIVSGMTSIVQSGRFTLDVVDVAGIESTDKIEGTITLTQDQRPIVRIVHPRPLSLATPDISLPVSLMAEDDYGVASVSLFRSINNSPATSVMADIEPAPRVAPQWELPLKSYGLEPGDEIQLFARAEDNDPDGSKGAESPVTVIRIISVQEFQEMLVQQKGAESIQAKYQEAQRHFEKLAEALREVEKAAKAAVESPDSEKAQAELQEKLRVAQHAAAEAASKLQKMSEEPFPIDVDRELAKDLEKMSEQASEMQDALSEMADAQNPKGKDGKPNPRAVPLNEDDRANIQKMLEQGGANREQLEEQAIESLNIMQKTLALMADEQQFSQIAAQQRDLEQRMNALKNADPKEASVQRRVSELETEQQQLRQSLDQLLDSIEQHTSELPDDPELQQLRETSQKFVDAVRKSNAADRMSSAQKQLLGDAFEQAQKDANEAADILESFLDGSQAMGQGAESSCKAAFQPGKGRPNLGNSLQQLMDMMGMKKGKSGMKPGNKPGNGMGTGAGGGFSQRFPGPQNIGMYGSVPTTQESTSRGRGDKKSQGTASASTATPSDGGNESRDSASQGDASGQADQSIPTQYRAQVAEYFRILSEQLGQELDASGTKP
ncbi:MAG: hypothetical protein ABL921_03505 [Pirellula sp.]